MVTNISIPKRVSSVGACCLLAKCRCRGVGAPKISLVNEVQCGTGTEWRDLIGQQKGGDYGNHQATLNFQLPEHVSSITFDGTGEEPEGDEKQKMGQLAIGLVCEGDWKAKSKMAGKGQRV